MPNAPTLLEVSHVPATLGTLEMVCPARTMTNVPQGPTTIATPMPTAPTLQEVSHVIATLGTQEMVKPARM